MDAGHQRAIWSAGDMTAPNNQALRAFAFNAESKIAFWLSLVGLLVRKELKVRYKGSVLGYMWSMLNPLLYMLILAFVFSHVMRLKTENYTLFILTGILSWNLFFQGVVLGTASIVNNASLLKKVKVSTTIFTAASIGSCLVNFVLALVPFLIISLAKTGGVPLTVALVPLALVPYVVFVFGISLALASLNVLFRDIAHMLDPVLNIVFYATPIIYPIDTIPERYRPLLELNPIASFVALMRSLMYEGRLPSTILVLKVLVLAAFSLGMGLLIHQKTRDKFIYRL